MVATKLKDEQQKRAHMLLLAQVETLQKGQDIRSVQWYDYSGSSRKYLITDSTWLSGGMELRLL